VQEVADFDLLLGFINAARTSGMGHTKNTQRGETRAERKMAGQRRVATKQGEHGNMHDNKPTSSLALDAWM
jgi:hypothetical protein